MPVVWGSNPSLNRLRSCILSYRRTTSKFMTSLLANFGCGRWWRSSSTVYETVVALFHYPAINFGGTGWIRTNSVSMCRIYSPMPIRRLSSRPNIVIIACCDYLSRRKFGAGEGNRTLVGALATLCFTIKLLPHYLYISFVGTLPKIRTWNWSFVDFGDIHFTKRA